MEKDGEDLHLRALFSCPADAPWASDSDVRVSRTCGKRRCTLWGAAALQATARPATHGERTTLRVMTYNVHSCVGMDGQTLPARIARVIARCDPACGGAAGARSGGGSSRSDGSHRSGQAIACELKMEFTFTGARGGKSSSMRRNSESLPMRLRHAAALPGLPERLGIEPRGRVCG